MACCAAHICCIEAARARAGQRRGVYLAARAQTTWLRAITRSQLHAIVLAGVAAIVRATAQKRRQPRRRERPASLGRRPPFSLSSAKPPSHHLRQDLVLCHQFNCCASMYRSPLRDNERRCSLLWRRDQGGGAQPRPLCDPAHQGGRAHLEGGALCMGPAGRPGERGCSAGWRGGRKTSSCARRRRSRALLDAPAPLEDASASLSSASRTIHPRLSAQL